MGIQLINGEKFIVDDTYLYATRRGGVYAGGDCFRGADLLVRAALDGKRVSQRLLPIDLLNKGEIDMLYLLLLLHTNLNMNIHLKFAYKY